MATLSTTTRHSAGSNNLLRLTFTGVTSADSWASNLKGVIGYWANCPVRGSTECNSGVNVSLSASNNTFYFTLGGYAGSTNTVDLYVLCTD